ncbi:hypothetical protein CPARK_000110600 [cyanobacterium endosymbiont of Braarudosphaera bigelowii]|uniref:Uncharacterized protein n=2 Tax=Candidatus Atelocyanobacterium thalassae TaxID=713887 RepID=A0A086CI91_9CHRO|nr:MAG: hypothetical protein ucyna2_00284 [Candidatus Atelocyanobacterium thalassa isolate SIO64986]BDA40269.1 hypothetical protein CPARK_000110600 [cyanobacterium endosymbiont of Braarudosphaera bigelowii]
MIFYVFPFLFFVISIGSILRYQRTNNDIFGVLAFATALVSIIWSLVISHWLIHILSLIILFKFNTSIFNDVQVKINEE